MKSVIVTSLILGTLSSTLNEPLIYLDFNLRREYIAEFLCIKKEEPITVCGGNCFLDLQLEKANKQQESEKSKIQTITQISFFNHDPVKLLLNLPKFIFIQKFNVPSTTALITSDIPGIFHPPRV